MTQLHCPISTAIIHPGLAELQHARRQCWPLYDAVVEFSILSIY